MQLINIKKKYDDNWVLKGIDLKFENKGLVFILGNSGSGKSTLLHIMGLLDTDYEGEIVLDKDIVAKNKRQVGKNIGDNIDFVFQDFNLIDSLSLEDNMQLASDIIGKKTEKKDINKICSDLMLNECKGRKTNKISGGEKQRTAIGRALIRNNTILLADEPTGNLDKNNEKNIFQILKKISKDRLVIVVTHNVDAAEQYGDRIVKIKDGVIEEDIDRGYMKNDVIVYEEKMNISKKSKNKWMWKLAISNLKSRKRKVFPSLIMMLICILSIGTIIGIVSNMQNMMSGIDDGVFENDKKNIECNYWNKGNDVISEEFLAELEEVDGIKYTNSMFKTYMNVMKDDEVFGQDIQYDIIEDNEFFRERYKLLAGDFPKNKNEVIINESFARRYFDGEEIIGNVILLEIGDGSIIECKVVGVKADKISVNDELYALPSFGDYLYELIITARCSLFDFPEAEREYNENLFDVNNSLEDVRNQEAYKLIYGAEPVEVNEILIDVDAVNRILGYMGSKSYYSNQELIDGELKEDDLAIILNAKVRYVATGFKVNLSDVNITGICASENSLIHDYSDDNTGANFYLSDTFFDGLLVRDVVTDVMVYIDNEKALKDIEALCKDYGYQLQNVNNELIQDLGYQMSTITMLMSVVAIIILLISVCMIHFAAKINAIDCAYEIGVLKSMGASNGFVFCRFLSENLIQGLIVGIVSVVIGVCLNYFDVVSFKGIDLLNLEWYNWVVIIVMSVIISVVSSVGENAKIARTDILKSIRNL